MFAKTTLPFFYSFQKRVIAEVANLPRGTCGLVQTGSLPVRTKQGIRTRYISTGRGNRLVCSYQKQRNKTHSPNGDHNACNGSVGKPHRLSSSPCYL